MNKMQILVKCKRNFDFVDKQSGKRILGCKLLYEGDFVELDNVVGSDLVSLNSENPNDFYDFPVIPAIYDVEFLEVSAGKGIFKKRYVSGSAKLVKEKTA